jgi:hypothetical protein
MSQEMPPRIPISDADMERYIDRPFDLVARVRAAKEAAQREMETFGHVSEYEIRKIYGQKTELSYDSPNDERPLVHPSSSDGQGQSPPIEHRKDESMDSQASFDFAAHGPHPQQNPVKEG